MARFNSKMLRSTAVVLLFSSWACRAAAQETDPPANRYRTVHREAQAGAPFRLISERQTDFSVWVADGSDPVLATAAADFGTYFRQRWGAPVPTVRSLDEAREAVVVLASPESEAKLTKPLRDALTGAGKLPSEGFVIRQVPLPSGRRALLCFGGSPIGARYATIEVLHRMTYGSEGASFPFGSMRDEPYSTWRAIYINDSSHQSNGYSPNLIYDVETFRWSLQRWYRYIDQMAFFRYNVLQIWIVPNMFSPDVFAGGDAFEYFRDTMRAVARYARPRGIQLCLLSPVNVAVKAGTRLDTLPNLGNLPMYTYLSPLKPAEKELSLRLWDYWSRAIPEVGIWSFFPGDPGGCAERGCGPETYVDLAVEISHIIKGNNPQATIDFTPWQFFGWGPSWTIDRKDSARVDRGYQYLVSHEKDFPPGTIFSPNVNDYTSDPAVRGAGFGGGSSIRYLQELAKDHLIHTWSYFATEGEGWINHHFKVAGILKQRDVESRYPISGGICYTMTPAFNILNQYACAESFWNPDVTEQEVMQRYTEGAFGASSPELIGIFPDFDIAPMVGYTFADAPDWRPDYARILEAMQHDRAVLTAMAVPQATRFQMLPTPVEYTHELIYFCDLYIQMAHLGTKVARARELIRGDPQFSARPPSSLRVREGILALDHLRAADRAELRGLMTDIRNMDVARWKREYRAKHYQIFIDYPTEFSLLLPSLIEGFFKPFGGDFLEDFKL
jgi:hypothetical protein